jgi:hypothetical protein
MPDNDKRKFELPWGTLLPLLAVLAGVVAQYKPLVSTRPAVPIEKTIPVIAAQDVDARLWQDPFGVTQKQNEQNAAGGGKKGAAEFHDISALENLLTKRAQQKERVLLLAVMIEAGPYSEQAETRLRARPAVLEALSESGFAPLDGEHIGFVTVDWPPPDDASRAPPLEHALLLPWEECIARDPSHAYPENTRWMTVLWLPAASFNPNPLSRFAYIIDKLTANTRSKIDIKLIGPANSTGLQSMVREVRQPGQTGLPSNVQQTLKDVSIFSPRATASDEWLLFRPPSAGGAAENRSASKKQTVRELLEEAAPGLTFVRTIAPDDLVVERLIAELARRRVPVVQQTTPDGRPISKMAHTVILTEWDTPYGKSLSTIFASLASGRSITEIIQQPDKWPQWVHPYRYLRGIDGRLPGDQAKESQHDQTQKTQLGPDTVAAEATEGLNQSDYLRRLARQMKQDDLRWQREDGFGIRAIGLLGSDIYDKLMILRALRPTFRDAVFFTNNYDAHFERRDDWDDTRNLIIASPFGSAVPETFSRQNIAPFRDTNQTATYVGTLVATGRMTKEQAEYLSWQPRIFEVSRQGAYDLSDPWYLEGKSLSVSNKRWFRDWLFAPGVIWLLIIMALTVLAMAAWISLSIARRTLPGGGTALERLKRALISTTFWLVCGGPLVVFVVALVAQYWGPEEPLAFFSGISIWPTEMLRLIAFLLAIFFMFKASFDLRANARKVEEEFSFTSLPLTRFRWRDLGIGVEHWRMKEPPRTSRFHAEEAWHAYLCRSKFWPRCIRVGVLFTLYFVFAAAIFSLFPQALAPARGEAAFTFDKVAFVLSGVGLLLLSFYVVDAIQLNSNFIRMFAREVTKWGRDVVDRSHRHPPLTEKELSAYHEIFFVAQRTQAVAPLIWYPLLVLTVLVVARSSFFDNWTWPGSLVLISAITAAWALGSAILLRRAAEQLRETALNDLRRFRLLGRASEEKRETFDELIAEIRDLKTGAFAPLTEQSFIRAVLFPGAGLGLLAVGQRLLDLF